jgi:hypothetical protein
MKERRTLWEGTMPHSKPDRGLDGLLLDGKRRQRVEETLGATPRDALAALVGYGLHDKDIARYHSLPCDLVTELREGWRIPPNP